MSGREMRQFLEAARKEGWSVSLSKGNHWRLTHPNAPGEVIFTSLTPSDGRAIANLRAQMRRALRETED